MSPRFGVSAFSLLELMIAIMILGIGVVMVATVFPVSLEIIREPIQTYLSMAVADAATATLKAKVPPYRELDQNQPNNIRQATPRILVPDVASTDLDADLGSSPEQQKDYEVVQGLFLYYLSPPIPPEARQAWYSYWGPSWTTGPEVLKYTLNANVGEFISRTRVFTERTGWSAEGEQSAKGWRVAFPVPSQNLPADLPTWNALVSAAANNMQSFLNSLPLVVHPSLADTYQTDLPRVNLVDQVYPPVSLNNPDGSDRSVTDVASDLRYSRYSWMAFHHHITTEAPPQDHLLTNRDFMVTIATLYRPDLYARFARQKTLDPAGTNYQVDFNTGEPVHQKAMLQPNADPAPATDAVFPRPWLVMVHINYDPIGISTQNQGVVYCSPEVARMLPNDAYFIIARNMGSYVSGTALKVTRAAEFAPSTLGSPTNPATSPTNYPWTQFEIARDKVAVAQNVPIWVFPPAINNLAAQRENARTDYDFATRSPVVAPDKGVPKRRIAVQ